MKHRFISWMFPNQIVKLNTGSIGNPVWRELPMAYLICGCGGLEVLTKRHPHKVGDAVWIGAGSENCQTCFSSP